MKKTQNKILSWRPSLIYRKRSPINLYSAGSETKAEANNMGIKTNVRGLDAAVGNVE